MKIRDLLVIIFTAIVALLVLGRSALADGPCPMEGMGGACMDKMSGSGEGPGPSFPIQLVDWMCADTCALICRDRCVVACLNSKDPECVLACYPLCASDCYDECTGPAPEEPEPVEYRVDPIQLLRDLDGGAPWYYSRTPGHRTTPAPPHRDRKGAVSSHYAVTAPLRSRCGLSQHFREVRL